MGNGCSSLFKVNKICYDDATNIIVEIKEDDNIDKKESNNSKKILNDKINFLKQKNQIKNENDINKINISSLSANNPNPYLFDKNRNQVQLNNNNNINVQHKEAKPPTNENMKS